VKTLSPFALKALSSVEVSGQTARVTAQLDRKLYLEVNDALEALGGKWSKKLKAHVFDGRTQEDIADSLEDVLACGGFVDKKQELGAFFTPAALADKLVKLADVQVDHTVLEPSAGRGAIVDALVRVTNARYLECVAIELDPANYKALLDSGSDYIFKGDFLLLSTAPAVCSKRGVCTWNLPPETPASFDRIVMNPPFRRGADIEHVLHAWKFLKPGGRLVSVMSEHVHFGSDKRSAEFRAFAAKYSVKLPYDSTLQPLLTRERAWFYSLPAGSFASSGTQVNTVVLVLEKPEAEL
jgi:predicted RNA methylase